MIKVTSIFKGIICNLSKIPGGLWEEWEAWDDLTYDWEGWEGWEDLPNWEPCNIGNTHQGDRGVSPPLTINLCK